MESALQKTSTLTSAHLPHLLSTVVSFVSIRYSSQETVCGEVLSVEYFSQLLGGGLLAILEHTQTIPLTQRTATSEISKANRSLTVLSHGSRPSQFRVASQGMHVVPRRSCIRNNTQLVSVREEIANVSR